MPPTTPPSHSFISEPKHGECAVAKTTCRCLFTRAPWKVIVKVGDTGMCVLFTIYCCFRPPTAWCWSFRLRATRAFSGRFGRCNACVLFVLLPTLLCWPVGSVRHGKPQRAASVCYRPEKDQHLEPKRILTPQRII